MESSNPFSRTPRAADLRYAPRYFGICLALSVSHFGSASALPPQAANASRSTVICAPIDTKHDGLSTQVAVSINEGRKHDSGIHCDALTSLPKADLTHYVGHLSTGELKEALVTALSLADDEAWLEEQ